MTFIRALTFTGLTLLISLFFVGQLFAQVAVVDIEPEETGTTSRLYMGYGHLFKTDIDGSGNVSRDGFRLL